MSQESLFLRSPANLTLRRCMEQIDSNHNGFVIITEESGKALGVLTDGDIRRALLKGAGLDTLAMPFINRNFISVSPDASREQILKLLDQKVKFIPVVRNGIVERVVNLADLDYGESGSVTARAKAPARISFGGGGTDLTPFFTQHGGAVLNATINRYSRCTLRRREDFGVKLVSTDFHLTVEAADAQSLVYDGNLDLIKAAIKLIRPNFGFDLEVSSDFPPSSGLGGSSVVLAAVIGCFNQFRNDRLDSYGIAELAFQAERIELNCSGGWQDQYAAVFGGFNFMEFRSERNEINSLRVPDEVQNELEDRLLLCFSGKAHPTRIIHDTQRDRMVNNEAVTAFAKRTRDLAYEMKYLLMRGQLDLFGKCMHDAWELKKNLSIGISDPELDDIYSFARAHGAIGGKILGAGGGGFFLFQSEKDQRSRLARAFKDRGLESHHCMFEDRGLRSWIVKS